MTFRQGWINILHGVATGTKKTRNLLTPIGAVIFFLFTACFLVGSLFVDKLLGLPDLLPQGMHLVVSFPHLHKTMATLILMA
jgi:hypothetical protein